LKVETFAQVPITSLGEEVALAVFWNKASNKKLVMTISRMQTTMPLTNVKIYRKPQNSLTVVILSAA